jgi:type I restriction enzyme S subunit
MQSIKEDWIETTLGEILKTTSGGTPSRSNKSFYKGNIPWVKSGELNDNTITETSEYISEEALKKSSAKIFPKGTILFALYGATIGKMAVLGIEASSNQAVCGIYENKDIISSKYLYNYLSYQKRNLIQQGIGGAQPNISQTILKKLIIPVAPIPIQRTIVAKIEELFSSLDSGIADLKKAKEQLKIYRNAILDKAFGEDIIVMAEKKALSTLTDKIGSGSTPRGGKAAYKSEGIPLIRSMNIHFDYIKYEGLAFIDEVQADKLKNVIIEEGDVLLNITGASIGRVNIAPKEFRNGRVNQHVSIIRSKANMFNHQYLKYFLQSPNIQNWIANANYGVTRQALTKGMLENLKIPLPDFSRQILLVQKIDARLSVCDKIEADIEMSLNSSQALRQSILKKAFEGELLSDEEIENCKKAHDYEPAGMLLEKIKAERKRK